MKRFFLNLANGEAVNERIVERLFVVEIHSPNHASTFEIVAALSDGRQIVVSNEYKTRDDAEEKIKEVCVFV